MAGIQESSGVVYATASSPGRGEAGAVAVHALAAAWAAGLLQQAIVYHRRDLKLPASLIKKVRFRPHKFFSWLPGRYYFSLKRAYLDRVTRKYLQKHGAALFHGWTHECLESLKVAREQGAVAVLERNHAHPERCRAMLQGEYDSRGLAWPPAPPSWLQRWNHRTRDQEEALEECRRADYLLLPSQFTYDSFRERGYPPEKLVLMPRGVDMAPFPPTAAEEKDAVFRVLFVGPLRFSKGVPYLLEAWAHLGLKDAELLLAGPVHEEMRFLLARYRGRGHIRLLDYREVSPALYARAKVFCLPSLDEGRTQASFAALAAGLPLVVTPEAGSVARHGQEGLIVPARQSEPLRAALERLYRHPEEATALGEKARLRAGEFTWEHYAQRLVAFYLQALQR
jgi:glycosyltransferase involved in cell wall biosynthesis